MKTLSPSARKRLRDRALQALAILPLIWITVETLHALVLGFPWFSDPTLTIGAALAGALTWFFAFSRREDLVELFVPAFWVAPILGGAITFPIWFSFASRIDEVQGSFFEVSAQIVPVLLLAITIDVRRSRSLESHELVLTIVILIIGEAVALYHAAGAEWDTGGYAVVSTSLTTGFIALVMALISDYAAPTGKGRQKHKRMRPADQSATEPSTSLNKPDTRTPGPAEEDINDRTRR